MLIYRNRKSSLPSACSMKSFSLLYTSFPSPRLSSHHRFFKLHHPVYKQAVQLRQSLHYYSQTRGPRELWSMQGKIATLSIEA